MLKYFLSTLLFFYIPNIYAQIPFFDNILKALEGDCEEIMKQKNKLRYQLINARNENTTLDKKLQIANNQNNELQTQIAPLRVENNQLKGSIKELETKVSGLETEKTNLLAENEKLRSNIRRLEIYIVSLKDTITKRNDSIRVLNKTLVFIKDTLIKNIRENLFESSLEIWANMKNGEKYKLNVSKPTLSDQELPNSQKNENIKAKKVESLTIKYKVGQYWGKELDGKTGNERLKFNFFEAIKFSVNEAKIDVIHLDEKDNTNSKSVTPSNETGFASAEIAFGTTIPLKKGENTIYFSFRGTDHIIKFNLN